MDVLRASAPPRTSIDLPRTGESGDGPARRLDQENARPRGAAFDRRDVLRRALVGFLLIVAAGLATGGLIVGPLAHSALTRWDRDRIVAFAAHRTASMNSVTLDISKAADAPGIIAIGLVIATVFAVRRRWWLVATTALILVFELASFLAINEVVRRRRPDVRHLGSVPSTGSFPSGHVEATVVVFGFVALALTHHSRIAAAASWLWTAVAAAAVGWSRMYRGMHFPSDVLAGALVGVAILVVFRPLIARADLASSRTRHRQLDSEERS